MLLLHWHKYSSILEREAWIVTSKATKCVLHINLHVMFHPRPYLISKTCTITHNGKGLGTKHRCVVHLHIFSIICNLMQKHHIYA